MEVLIVALVYPHFSMWAINMIIWFSDSGTTNLLPYTTAWWSLASLISPISLLPWLWVWCKCLTFCPLHLETCVPILQLALKWKKDRLSSLHLNSYRCAHNWILLRRRRRTSGLINAISPGSLLVWLLTYSTSLLDARPTLTLLLFRSFPNAWKAMTLVNRCLMPQNSSVSHNQDHLALNVCCPYGNLQPSIPTCYNRCRLSADWTLAGKNIDFPLKPCRNVSHVLPHPLG